MDFKTAENLFKSEKLNELASTKEGAKFLRLRSLSRSKYLLDFLGQHGVDAENLKVKEQLPTAFSLDVDQTVIDSFIKQNYEEERKLRREQEEELFNELYKLKVFDWGGLHQNSLEKTIVDNYIKKISSYDQIEKKIETDLQSSLRGYVLCSWYNHWTSILIEDVFKDHKRVLPALGLIPKIDFFIDETPFDLKVTYLPEGYIAESRRSAGLKPELTLLKQSARSLGIPIDSELTASEQLENLWMKHTEFQASGSNTVVKELENFRFELISSIENNSTKLIKWLYENQGIRRFDASNRFFIVLVNTGNFFEGWKLKRALPLLKKATSEYLDAKKDVGKDVSFEWEGQTYQVKGDVLVIKN
ncbi:hypothetical protein RAE19_10110 [Rhodoferax sp. TBRC 17660]|uniref:Uncharacterized protein n=1 Tax=Rhodoferax potami TaxID=3068338 RepID=A0ABU3KMT6_9BURK|nr:hypothetical protein [Rhodoferax sp. TBRC 17660]MDT7519061.1 hypothetical protein [Rhodoferax sp. TBRC 17660]